MNRARQPRMAGVDVGQAFAGDQAERSFEAGHVRERRRAAELAVREIALAAQPVPVEARRRVAPCDLDRARVGGDEGQARVDHQPFLRCADRDVDAELVHRERRRGERCDDVDDEERRMCRRVDRTAQRRQVAGRAAGGVGVDDEDGADRVPAVVAQRRLDRRRIDRQALDVRRSHGAAAERLDLLGPTVGEVAGAGHQDRRSGRDQVGDHRFPAAVTVGGVEEDIGTLGREQRLHPRFAGADQRGRRASARSVGWRAIALTTSSGTRVGPGEWSRRMPGMRAEVFMAVDGTGREE